MMHIEFLVEDSSGARLLQHLVPKLTEHGGTSITYRIHSYKGIGKIPSNDSFSTTDARKRILLNRLPAILKGYAKTPGIDAIVVLVDSDRKDCSRFLKELQSIASMSGHPNTLFRIAIEEVEAWYLGDHEAIKAAYGKARLHLLKGYDQDSVCGTWELLADIVHPGGSAAIKRRGWPLPGQLKHEWAENIGPFLCEDRNVSPSFKKFCEGVRGLADSKNQK